MAATTRVPGRSSCSSQLKKCLVKNITLLVVSCVVCVSLVNIFGGVIILLVDIFQLKKKQKIDHLGWLGIVWGIFSTCNLLYSLRECGNTLLPLKGIDVVIFKL